jgi:hypothetical protein
MTQTHSPHLLAVKAAVDEFHNVQAKHIKLGACDTEPCFVFERILEDAIDGEDVEIPTTAGEWELYTSSPGAEDAAKEMRNAAYAVVERVQSAPISAMAEIRKYLIGD